VQYHLMSAATYTVLTEQEDRTLLELRLAQTVPQRTRDRAHMIRLNAQHWSVPQIAKIFECHRAYGATIRRWELHGLGGLWKVPGSGAKPKGQEADLQHLEQALATEPRTYNCDQWVEKLAQERQVAFAPVGCAICCK
jgi:hypothetical protein